MPVSGHRDLRVWQESMQLARMVYELTENLPRQEAFGLTAQLRRAAVSIPSNIAEGAARSSKREFAQSLSIARGSLAEVETQLLLARDLGYAVEIDQALARINSLFRSMTALMKAVRTPR